MVRGDFEDATMTDQQRWTRWTRVALGLLVVGCRSAPDRPGAPADSAGVSAGGAHEAGFREASWTPPTEADIPDSPLGVSIRRGLALLRFTPESLPPYATSNLRCTSCHRRDGLEPGAAPLTGAHARYPKFLPRTGAVIPLADRVNYCITRSLSGRVLPVESREMQDMLAYLAFISWGVPVGTTIAGTDGLLSMDDTLSGDSQHGAAVYARDCVSCHGADGAGVGVIPALWGARSYSIGASMAREERAASMIWHNMPLTKPGSLTRQEAFDVAAFVNAHPRPDSPGKENDWPAGKAPADVPYDTKGHVAYHPPARLLVRQHPRDAIVPKPASVVH